MARAIARAVPKAAALRALPLLDLADPTALEEMGVMRLCAAAKTPFGPVASVVVARGAVPLAKHLLAGSQVRTGVAVADEDEIAAAIGAGAEEIELAFPLAAFRAGDRDGPRALIRRCRAACRRRDGANTLLKAVLETGQLSEPVLIREAAVLAIMSGADLIVTASGDFEPGTSLPGATAMVEAIAACRADRVWAGFKAAGLRTLGEAVGYLSLAERVLGAEFLGPATCRIAGPDLLGDIRAALGGRG